VTLPTEGVEGLRDTPQIAPPVQQADPSPTPEVGLGGANEVQLGDVVVPVYPQRIAYLENRLGRTVREFVEAGGIDTSDFAKWLGSRTYSVLAALIPSLPSRMPEHVFRGYPTPEAYAAADYDPEADRSPTFPEIVDAFDMAVKVNRFDLLGNLKSLVDPTVLRRMMSAELATRYTSSRSSTPPPGDSDPTSSTTPDPTSTDPTG
jgi:hypothetical protein